jgi:polysaccharide export outer membrane protein
MNPAAHRSSTNFHDIHAQDLMKAIRLSVMMISVVLVSCSTSSTSRPETDDEILTTFLKLPTDSAQTLRETPPVTDRPGTPFYQTIDLSDIRITPGDSVAVSVWGYPEFSTRTIVRPSGTIVVPLLGELTLVGLTRDQFTSLVRERLEQFVQGEIRLTVEVIPPSPTIIIVGAVSRPGNYPLTKEAPLLYVISLAGGWTPAADLRDVRIIRRSQAQRPISVDLIARLEMNETYMIPNVLPGDAILIPQREDFFSETAGFFASVFAILILLGLVSGFQ